ncbi:hypothetical protein [Spirochaeta isovalerica]|uniref:Uncharacterized protein (UPF0212 family) n=1 Tax=Spirochaeta isovalerica TaxID=150 RepID=A0A841R949_9SPIO|nr:hypothetical protein [Spirochaeta isovalerica]MBB6480316.1 uncharacterized protein (UPF0212 family) [Spirochaeta isovalerica]
MFRYFKSFPDAMYISIEKAGYNLNKQGIEVVDLDDLYTGKE